MTDAEKGLTRIYETLARADAAIGTSAELGLTESALVGRFRAAMDDDCNTPRALGVIFDGVRELNRELDAGHLETVAETRRDLAKIGNVLGFLGESPEQFLQQQQQSGLAEASRTPEAIEALVAERAAARKSKDFQRADEIRDELADQGIILKDSPTGTTWTVK
jgi:cysteinyl-tRNA synthetase